MFVRRHIPLLAFGFFLCFLPEGAGVGVATNFTAIMEAASPDALPILYGLLLLVPWLFIVFGLSFSLTALVFTLADFVTTGRTTPAATLLSAPRPLLRLMCFADDSPFPGSGPLPFAAAVLTLTGFGAGAAFCLSMASTVPLTPADASILNPSLLSALLTGFASMFLLVKSGPAARATRDLVSGHMQKTAPEGDAP